MMRPWGRKSNGQDPGLCGLSMYSVSVCCAILHIGAPFAYHIYQLLLRKALVNERPTRPNNGEEQGLSPPRGAAEGTRRVLLAHPRADTPTLPTPATAVHHGLPTLAHPYQPQHSGPLNPRSVPCSELGVRNIRAAGTMGPGSGEALVSPDRFLRAHEREPALPLRECTCL